MNIENMPLELASVLSKIEKKSGDSIFIGDMPDYKLIPFSSPTLNYLTRGGIPFGASTEIVGEEHSGKSTLAQDLIKNYQIMEEERVIEERARLEKELEEAKSKRDKTRIQEELDSLVERPAVYLDIERTLNPQWLNKLGVNEDKVIVFKPTEVGMEGPLEDIISLMETGQVGMVVIDSIGQMISTAEVDKKIGDGHYGGIAKSLTQYYRKASTVYSKHNIAHVVINQTREDMSGYGTLVRPGGKAHAFAQSVTLRLRPGARYDDKYAPVSQRVELVHARETIVQMVKNKVRGADRQATSFTIRPNYGIDVVYDTLEMGRMFGVIAQSGSWYTIFDPYTGEEKERLQGQANVYEYLENNLDELETLRKYLYEKSLED